MGPSLACPPSRAARRPAWCRRRRSRSSCASMRARGGRCGQPRRSRRSARRLDASCRCSGRAARRSSRDLAPACGLDADQLRHAIGALVACGLATSDGFSGLRALVWAARGRPAQHDRRSNFAGRWTAIAATRRGRHARRGGRAPGVVAAPPLRGRVPAAAHPRDERRDVARARARVPAPRGARRDPQRPVRDGHVGRAVRAAGRRRTAARGSAHPGRRRSGHHQRGRSAEPHGDCHRGRTDPDRRPQPDRLSRRRAARRRRRRLRAGACADRPGIAADVSRALKARRVPALALQ